MCVFVFNCLCASIEPWKGSNVHFTELDVSCIEMVLVPSLVNQWIPHMMPPNVE